MRSIAVQRRDECVERQAGFTELLERRRAFNQATREHHSENKGVDDMEFWGAQGVPGFRRWLTTRCGSLVAGWRALDKDQNGHLSFYEFCNACRTLGYAGNLKLLWTQLDRNLSGQVSLIEIDPEVGKIVGEFKKALLNEYHDMLTAWQKGIDVSGNGRVEEREMTACVEKLGLPFSGKKVFKVFAPHGSFGITLEDLDPDANKRFRTGDLQGLVSKAGKEFLEDLPEDGNDVELPPERSTKEGGAREWRAELRRKDRGEASKLRLGMRTVPELKKALISRCGSLFGAWKEALDLDGNGRLTFGEFCLAMDRLSFHGDLQGLWRQLLKDGQHTITFAELDPETDAQISELRAKLVATHGNMLLAWVKGLDTNGTGVVTKEEFIAGCATVGFSGDAEKLHKLMQPDANRSFLTLKDLDTKAHHALQRGDLRMLSEGEEKQSPTKSVQELSFYERQQSGFQYQFKEALKVAEREEYAKSCKMPAPAHVIDTAEEFEMLCKRTYGTIIAAWRQCLDVDGNGKLTFNELCKALRRLGYAGDFTKLWQKYTGASDGGGGRGHIALKDIDPEADLIVNDFLLLLASQYGTLDDAWKLGFGKDPHETIDEVQLGEACTKLGFSHSPKQLFKCLQPVPGKLLITIWDLDPFCTRKRQRGEEVFIAQPKSPLSATAGKKSFGQAGNDKQAKAQADAERALKPSEQKHEAALKAGREALPQARQVLKQKYGSTVAAWREALDPKGAGSISFGNFMIVLEDCAFKGNVKGLWKVLCGDRGTAMFRDIDPDSQQMLDVFREELVGRFGSITEAWKSCFDPANTGIVTEADFVKAAESLPTVVKSASKLYRALLARPSQHSLIKTDFRALLIGLRSFQERENVWASVPSNEEGNGAEDNGESNVEGNSPPISPGTSRSASPNTSQTLKSSKRQALQEPSPRAAARAVTEEWHSQDKVISSVAGLKRMLTSKYGSYFAAWRNALDVDHKGVMAQLDFANACRELGIKAVGRLWAELDSSGSGRVTLKDFDPDTDEVFSSLEALIKEKYPTTKAGWKTVFDPDGNLRTDLAKFKAGCASIGFVGNADKAFKLLLPFPGGKHLTYEDLWPNYDRNGNFPQAENSKVGAKAAAAGAHAE